MIDLEEILKNLEIDEKDRENIRILLPVIKNYGYEIIDEVVKVLSKDPEIVKILQEDNLPVSKARDAWFYWLKTLFSSEFDEEFVRKLSHIGQAHVDGNVKESIVIQTTFLFLMKTLDKLLSLKLDNFTELSKSVIKLFSLSLVIMINSYREELIDSFLEFTGLKEDLFNREIKMQRKKRREKRHL